jgi:hypothetical protein
MVLIWKYHPDNKRIHYVCGLIDLFKKEIENQEMLNFVKY